MIRECCVSGPPEGPKTKGPTYLVVKHVHQQIGCSRPQREIEWIEQSRPLKTMLVIPPVATQCLPETSKKRLSALLHKTYVLGLFVTALRTLHRARQEVEQLDSNKHPVQTPDHISHHYNILTTMEYCCECCYGILMWKMFCKHSNTHEIIPQTLKAEECTKIIEWHNCITKPRSLRVFCQVRHKASNIVFQR